MAHLLSDLASYFNLDEINIDNWTFKLYYKVSMVICMTGATVGIASQYFGDPIRLVMSSATRKSYAICMGYIVFANDQTKELCMKISFRSFYHNINILAASCNSEHRPND